LEIKVKGQVPSARSFQKSIVSEKGELFILGGFDGERKNDLFKIEILGYVIESE
jgi:hypothetical protein